MEAARKRVNLASKGARGTHGQGDGTSKYRGESTGRHEQDWRPVRWETEGGDGAEVRNGK